MAAFEYVNTLQVKVIKELDSRNAKLNSETLTVYDYAPKMVTQGKLTTWSNYENNKKYTFAMPIGVATSLMKLLMGDTDLRDLSLKSFASVLYVRLVNIIEPTALENSNMYLESYLEPVRIPDYKLESHGQQV
jgi:hypothetical protein